MASTPAMFNSTLTQDEANHCPVDGAIMITGLNSKFWNFSRLGKFCFSNMPSSKPMVVHPQAGIMGIIGSQRSVLDSTFTGASDLKNNKIMVSQATYNELGSVLKWS